MPTMTYTPLANITVGTAAVVQFSNIPATYRDLVLVIRGATNLLRVNADTGSNYSTVSMYGNGSATGSGSETNTYFYQDWWGGGTAANRMTIVQFMDYSATDKHKSILVRSSLADSEANANAVRWASTSAITSIQTTSNAPVGSTFALYGVIA